MFTYADPGACVSCRAHLVPGRPDCPRCGVVLTGALAGRLFGLLLQADLLARQLRAAPVPAAPAPDAPATVPAPVPPAPAVPMPAPPPPRSGVRTSSVPAILLATGALCLLVAAVIFLAVAWSWLGVGGRTAVLVTLTGAGLLLAPWLHRRGLVVAAESLVTVALGLVVLDVVGADDAGWLGRPGPAGLLVVLGLALTGGSAAVLALRRLVVPQLAGVLGLVLVLLGAQDVVSAPLATGLVGVAAFGGVGALARRGRLPVAAVGAVTTAGGCWLAVAALAARELGELDAPTFAAVWADGPGWALAVCAAALAAVALVPRLDPVLADLALAAAGVMATALVALPVADEGATALGVVSLALGTAWLAGLAATRRRPLVAGAPAALALAPAVLLLLQLLAEAALRTLVAGADLRLGGAAPVAHPGLVLATTAVLLGVVAGWVRDRRALPELGLGLAVAAVATLALHPVPLWSVTASLVVVGVGYAATARLAPAGAAPPRFVGGTAVALGALATAHPSTGLLLATSAVLALLGAGGQVAGRDAVTRSAGAVLLPLAVAGVVATGGAVLDVRTARLGVPVLLVVAALALVRPRVDTELAATAAGVVAVVVAVAAAPDVGLAASVHLTLAGALLSLTAVVHPHRRPVGGAGSAVLVLALWVRLADAGVVAPEAYTLPPALALVAVALYRLWRDPASPTALLLPGLVLATTPSLLRLLLADLVSLRALLLGLGCLALVLAGAALRWSAPLLVGAAVGAALTLLELAPYAARTPQWVVIGLAGTVLTLVGTTWERRVVELRRAAGYVGRLR